MTPNLVRPMMPLVAVLPPFLFLFGVGVAAAVVQLALLWSSWPSPNAHFWLAILPFSLFSLLLSLGYPVLVGLRRFRLRRVDRRAAEVADARAWAPASLVIDGELRPGVLVLGVDAVHFLADQGTVHRWALRALAARTVQLGLGRILELTLAGRRLSLHVWSPASWVALVTRSGDELQPAVG